MRRSVAVAVLLGALLFVPAAADARDVEAAFEPRRIEAAPGQTVSVRVTPTTVEEAVVTVMFSVDEQNSRGVRNRGPAVASRRNAAGFDPVDLQLFIPKNTASGEIPVTVIAQALAEGERPGPTRRDRIIDAFTLAVVQVPSVDLLIGVPAQSSSLEESSRITVEAPGRAAVRLVARSKGGFAGTINITHSARGNGASILNANCPPEGGAECALQSLTLDVPGDGEAVAEVLLSVGESATGERIEFTALAPGLPPKAAFLNLSVAKPGSGIPTPAAPAPRAQEPAQLFLQVSRPAVSLAQGAQERIKVDVVPMSRWRGIARVTVTAPPWVRVEPANFTVRVPGSAELTISSAGTGSGGRIAIHAAGGGATTSVEVPVDGAGGVPVHPVPPPPDFGSGAPLPPLPPQFGSAASAVESRNRHLDDLGQTLSALPAVIDPRHASHQTAMLRFYEGMLAELRNPSSFALNDDGIDPDIVTEMIARSAVFERDTQRREAIAEIAALTGPQVLFQMDYPLIADKSGIPAVRPGQAVSFKPSTKVENLMLQLMLARSAAGVQMMVTGPAREAIDALNNGVEKVEETIGEKNEGRLKKALKRLMVVTAAVTVADVSAKAVMAYFPNEITAFYTEIKGVRRSEGDPPVDIVVGEKAPIRALIETRSPGGQIVTPSEVAGWVWNAVPLDDVLGRFPGLNKIQFKGELQNEVRSELIKLVERVWTQATGLPPVKEWLAAMDKSWDVKPFNNPPVEVNSNKVLKLESRSPALIRIGETRALENQYHIEGLHEGTQAGYHVALKSDLIEAFNTFSRAQLGRYAVVNVVPSSPRPRNPCPGVPNASPNAGKSCRYAEGYGEGSKDGVLILPAGGDGSAYPGVVLCDGTCAFPR